MKGFDEFERKGDPTFASKDGQYIFDSEPKHILRSALKNNPMSGVTFSSLIRLLYKKRQSIDWWRYKHRILGLICMSMVNSFLSFVESAYVIYLFCFKETRECIIQAITDDQPPVFIIGHPRTGTTLLHNMLSLDDDRFAFATTFSVGFPHSFLCFETIGKWLFRGILTETRPMDNMKLDFDLPQEDELGTNVLSGFEVSPYTSLIFMKEYKHYERYCCFRSDAVEEEDTKRWCYWFKYFTSKIKIRDMLQRCRKKSTKRKQPRRLLLKSPCHMGRIRLFLRLYPEAKFIFIHRNPFDVFMSSAHLASTTFGWMYLQEPSDADIQEYTLSQGELLYNELFECKKEGLLTSQNCVDVSFAELTKEPKQTVQRIYEAFGFDSFQADSCSSFPKRLELECNEMKTYKRNQYDHIIIDDKLKMAICDRWKRQMEELGYDKK